mmetsp:Transcript_77323/g.129721  ORF Transcript_77323/g.129721 Transcript_77323/m.129721 type:complete len:196 (-) Transcript_77323:105-692(-)|eukprot:CAMPEP_0174290922 /NCGR_PEP_ID=MMETSP0809-20121228/30544_1 /TAXON_ID=73025 ORGANISM="Eutreptiella gymnastica-like, Strain CCMP1594" /NCGR_SAMPLE_ID=MMETSP0809 /ASSEMBLY_ACC=CAM_ASM_000658 /LENGTH=195 /DNA_ID=CAMNT_0015389935 /DNA_START=60 /DNA_END=647 /DNA_ORIENTATION=+
MAGGPGRIIFGFALLALMRGIDFEDDTNLFLLRVLFGTVQVILGICVAVLYQRIRAQADTTEITVPIDPKAAYIDPDPDSPKTKVVTIEDYDIGQVKQLCMKVVMGCLIGAFIHYKWNVTAPLFMQCFLLPMQVIEHQLAKVYLFGQPAKGALARPWKEETPFDAFKMMNEPDENKIRQEEKKKAREAKKAKKAK